ncbi:MAG: mandelate racemase/muconate lactonizing enzyme family protein [Paracoccus sp. (in: a-proteobacteria)]|nr:mandelate racemase/muconate lactonizing enzyme family protein [Paracoccus sp. (in: a-proteobacteria)]
MRAPIARPVATSFGVMRNRPAVFLRIEDTDGAFGWGEAFTNWPAAGAEHRVNLLVQDVSDLLFGRDWCDPPAMFHELSRATHIRALQCGEPGPFRQVIAALDIAAWDLVARRAGLPLKDMLAPGAPSRVPAYASGIHINAAATEITRARTAGFRAFKVKVGFDNSAEPGKLREVASLLEPGDRLFADANQAWNADQAEMFLTDAADIGLGWMEEPIPADAPEGDWARLAALSVPLAAGENIAGHADYDQTLARRILRYVQPDLCKWGGVTGCLHVARQTLQSGATYCPHFLGGGIGLVASAHVLAAAGGPGLLEIDVNPNPLRDLLIPVGSSIRDGQWHMPDTSGLGIVGIPEEMLVHATLSREVS